jgi:hypothetical protein
MRTTVTLCIVLVALTATAHVTEEELWIPAAASNPGLHGTMWTTDLWLGSRVLDAPIEVRAAFLPDQQGVAEPDEVIIELQPSTQVEILDAVATLFGENRPGAIRLRSEHPFVAQSRTANGGGESGSFGQGIPAFKHDSHGEGFTFIGASNAPGADGHRTNLGIVNGGMSETSVMITARDGQTLDPLGTVFVDIGPNGWYQTDVFSLFGVDDQTVTLGYLSRVDNRSGDGTFIAPTTEPYVRIVSRLWEVEANLTTTGSVVVERVEYTTADGTATVENPGSGFSTGVLEIPSPTTFCIRAVGEVGPEAGSIEFEVNQALAGSHNWATGRGSISWGEGTSAAPLDEEHCEVLD